MLKSGAVVIDAELKVEQELATLGLNKDIVQAVAFSAASARADALPIDPCIAPGMFAYIYGVRAIRLHLIPLGWEISRAGNVESVVNHELGIQILFQNVDQACTPKDPEAVSDKGPASRNLICSGQTELFPREQASEGKMYGVSPTVWLICVSADDNSLRAEVSCPRAFNGNQFEGFVKRLFVVDESSYPSPTKQEEDFPDLNVRVLKK